MLRGPKPLSVRVVLSVLGVLEKVLQACSTPACWQFVFVKRTPSPKDHTPCSTLAVPPPAVAFRCRGFLLAFLVQSLALHLLTPAARLPSPAASLTVLLLPPLFLLVTLLQPVLAAALRLAPPPPHLQLLPAGFALFLRARVCLLRITAGGPSSSLLTGCATGDSESAASAHTVSQAYRATQYGGPVGSRDLSSRCLCAALADVVVYRDQPPRTDLLSLPALVLSSAGPVDDAACA